MAPRRNVAPPADMGEAVAMLAERVAALEAFASAILPGSGEWEFVESGGRLRALNRRTNVVQDLPAIVATVADIPAAGLYRGLIAWETTSGRQLVYYGATTGWRPPWDMPWGRLDFTSAIDFAISATSPTVGADRLLTGLVPGRRLRMDLQTGSHFGTVLGDTFGVDVTMDSLAFLSAENIQVNVAGHYIPPGLIRRYAQTTGTTHQVRSLVARLTGTGSYQHRGNLSIYDDGPNVAAAPVA